MQKSATAATTKPSRGNGGPKSDVGKLVMPLPFKDISPAIKALAGTVRGACVRLETPAFVSTPIRRKISLRTPAGKRNNVTVTFQHKTDPRQDILDRLGALPEGVVQFSRILVAVYQPPMVDRTEGGVILTPVMQSEDLEEYLWQGKVGLIVAMGSQAYVDDEATKFHGVRNRVGDWVWFRPSNGDACEVNGVFCRVFSESGIFGPIPHPDYVW